MIDLKEISRCVQSGKAPETAGLVNNALEEKYSVEEILKEGLTAGINAAEGLYLYKPSCAPKFLAAARALNRGLRTLEAAPESENNNFAGTIIAGTVHKDFYDIEKNIMVTLMRCRGLQVVDLGVSVEAEKFIDAAVEEEDARLIVCTANLVGTMVNMKGLLTAAENAGIRSRVKILIAGKPVTERYCAAIGADYYARDITAVAEIATAHCRRSLKPAA
ncbi:corrinoid methyltransferase [Spirochaetia bacterium]|nr:corrinoid methyltransferase [Spirochaetia bacterium]